MLKLTLIRSAAHVGIDGVLHKRQSDTPVGGLLRVPSVDAAPGEIRKYYREQMQDLIYGALTNDNGRRTAPFRSTAPGLEAAGRDRPLLAGYVPSRELPKAATGKRKL